MQILRRRQVEQRIGLSRSVIYDKINPKSKRFDPSFPRPIKLGDGKNPPVGWFESEIDRWLAARNESSCKAACE